VDPKISGACCPAGKAYSLTVEEGLQNIAVMLPSERTVGWSEGGVKWVAQGYQNHMFLQIKTEAKINLHAGLNVTKFVLVGGGGAGGGINGGGGGAGGFISISIYLPPGTYVGKVGLGGAASTAFSTKTHGENGGNTTFMMKNTDSTYTPFFTAIGGGGGGKEGWNGNSGGSGGGVGKMLSFPPDTLGQYFPGGSGVLGQGNRGGGVTNKVIVAGYGGGFGAGGGGASMLVINDTSRRYFEYPLVSEHSQSQCIVTSYDQIGTHNSSYAKENLRGYIDTQETGLSGRRSLGQNFCFDIYNCNPICYSGTYMTYLKANLENTENPFITWTCSLCTVRSYCVGGDEINEGKGFCSQYPNSNTLFPGATSESDCVLSSVCWNDVCTPGYYCDKTVPWAQNPCKICPRDYYCPSGSDAQPCPFSGQSALGSSSSSQCRTDATRCQDTDIFCGAGTYCSNGRCSVCPANSFCPKGTINFCPFGYLSAYGSDGLSDCRLLYVPEDKRVAGWGYDSNNAQVAQLGGEGIYEYQYISDSAFSNMPQLQKVAYGGSVGQSDNGVPVGGNAEYIGSGGHVYYGSMSGGAGADGMITLTFAPQCYECIPGTYRAAGVLQSSCQRCQVGKFSDKFASSACTACPAGKYNAAEGSASCLDCSNGRYFDNAAVTCSFASGCNGPSAQSCSQDVFSSVHYCTQCAAGYFLENKLLSKTPYSTCLSPGIYEDTAKNRTLYYTDARCIECRTAKGICTQAGYRLEFCQQGYTRDAECVRCTNAPENATYTKPADSNLDNCEYKCNDGFYNYTQYKDRVATVTCLKCADLPCPTGFYRTGCTGPIQNPVCLACDTYGNLPSLFNWSTYPGTIVMCMP
jgi:hypothetical protein